MRPQSGVSRSAALGRDLALSSHPAPSVAVTVFAAVLAVRVGDDAATTVVLTLAVLSGQLSIGWSNDRIDAARDRSTGRADKPLAAAAVPARVVDIAIGVSLAATIAFSLALGVRAGLVHLFAVACGWAYNAALKATWLSWLPFAVAFGALPGVATLALPGSPAPAAWLVLAGALLGVSAHLTNTVPDLETDRANGIVGFPHRIGARASLALSTVLLAVASAATVVGPRTGASALQWAGLAVVVVVGTVGLAFGRPGSRLPFYTTLALVGLVLLLLVAGVARPDFRFSAP